jgi:hypothetical protein
LDRLSLKRLLQNSHSNSDAFDPVSDDCEWAFFRCSFNLQTVFHPGRCWQSSQRNNFESSDDIDNVFYNRKWNIQKVRVSESEWVSEWNWD